MHDRFSLIAYKQSNSLKVKQRCSSSLLATVSLLLSNKKNESQSFTLSEPQDYVKICYIYQLVYNFNEFIDTCL